MSLELNGKDGSTLILVPAGKFIMGSNDENDEKPPHEVYLDDFYIGKYEVTNEQFARFVKDGGYDAEGDWKSTAVSGRESHPVVYVTWNDAVAYCNWAGLRLPTEAEWEKAARGADGRKWPWGNEWDANLCNNSETSRSDLAASMAPLFDNRGTTPVGSILGGASPFGVLDCAGNVWEWCADWYDSAYLGKSPRDNPQGPQSGSYRVIRGGGWGSVPRLVRCSFRDHSIPGYRYYSLGFRPARSR